MLIVILILIAWHLKLYFTRPPTFEGDPYGGLILVLALLFSHFAFAFKWRRSVSIALSILAYGWIFFTVFYIFYLVHVLYPSEPSFFSLFNSE